MPIFRSYVSLPEGIIFGVNIHSCHRKLPDVAYQNSGFWPARWVMLPRKAQTLQKEGYEAYCKGTGKMRPTNPIYGTVK